MIELLFGLVIMAAIGGSIGVELSRTLSDATPGGPGAGVDNILLTTGDHLLLVDGTSVLLRAG